MHFPTPAPRPLTALACLFAITGALRDAAATPPAPPPASSYAPVDDLAAQIEYYIKRTDDLLADPNEFDDAAKTRLKKDANTLTALALVLGLHDAEHPLKPATSGILKASQALAAATDHAAATAALQQIKQSMAGQPADSAELAWQPVASLEQLMKIVPTINAALKRGTTPQRFETLQQQSAGHAAALAAIAQVSTADTEAVKNPADLAKWYACCADMRDAAGSVNAAIRAGDQMATTKAMSRLAASCESCHATFRKEGH